jgi:F1F0 ATPase subunit 2
MDAARMTVLVFVAHLAAGILLGIAYFTGVWWSARSLVQGSGAWAIAGTALRLLLAGALLAMASRGGALPLLAMAAGVLIGRAATLRRLGRATS